jgi:anti-sigma regulatory factor (Ser/Thr protein kinase)
MTTGTSTFQLELPAVPGSVAKARHAVRRHIERDGVDVDLDAVALVVSELLANVVVHAYRDRPEPGTFRVQAEVTHDGFELEVRDDGIGMSPRADSPGLGLGLPLVARLTRHVEVEVLRGTRVFVRFGLAG